MSSESEPVIALTTAPDIDTARRMAAVLLESRIVACVQIVPGIESHYWFPHRGSSGRALRVQIVPGIESHYWWRGKVDCSAEILMILKTVRARLPDLERCLHTHHPYQVPEFVIVPVVGGSASYLQWMAVETLRGVPPKDGAPAEGDTRKGWREVSCPVQT